MGVIADELDRSLLPLYAVLSVKTPVIVTGIGMSAGMPGPMGQPMHSPASGLELVPLPVRKTQMESIFKILQSISKAVGKLEDKKPAQRPGLPAMGLPKMQQKVGDQLEHEVVALAGALSASMPLQIHAPLPAPLQTPFLDVQMDLVSKISKSVVQAIKKLEDAK